MPDTPTHSPAPCPGCGYDLRGLAPGVCPECGRAFTAAQVWRAGADRPWRWQSLRRSVRLTVWLWSAMLGGLAVLRLLEGQGLSGWLAAAAIAAAGLGAGLAQRAWLIRAERETERYPAGPSRAMRWGVGANGLLSILIAIPVAGMAVLLLLGMIAGAMW